MATMAVFRKKKHIFDFYYWCPQMALKQVLSHNTLIQVNSKSSYFNIMRVKSILLKHQDGGFISSFWERQKSLHTV